MNVTGKFRSSLREIADKSELGITAAPRMVDLVKGRRSVSIRALLSADKSPFRGAIVRGLRGHAERFRGRPSRDPEPVSASSDFGFSIGPGSEPVEGWQDGYRGTFYEIIGRG